MDIAVQTIRKEGFLALYKGESFHYFSAWLWYARADKDGMILFCVQGMASPLVGVAGVNSLLFASNALFRSLISPYPQLSIPQVALAGSAAGAVQSLLASPVEMFKIRMQGQYGSQKQGGRLRDVVGDMYSQWGWRQGIMRGFWVCANYSFARMQGRTRTDAGVSDRLQSCGRYQRMQVRYSSFASLEMEKEKTGSLTGNAAPPGFYSAYEYSKRSFQSHYGSSDIPVWATLTSGGAGGIAYWTACYPLGQFLSPAVVHHSRLIDAVSIRCGQVEDSIGRATSAGPQLYFQHF